MEATTLRPAEILATFADPVPGVSFRLSAEIQARIFTALARFLSEHPELPPLAMPSCGVRFPEVEEEPGLPYVEAQVRTEVPDIAAVAVWAAAAGVDVELRPTGSDVRVSAEIRLPGDVHLTVWGVERVRLRPSPRQALDDLLRARLAEPADGEPAGGAR